MQRESGRVAKVARMFFTVETAKITHLVILKGG